MELSEATQRALAAQTRAQVGLVTRAQAFEAGLTRHQIATRLTAGEFIEVARGLYRVAGAAETWEQRVWAACLATGGLASHRTAGWLFGLEGLGRSPPREADVIVPFTASATSPVATVHRSRTLHASHAARGAGIPRTSLARTVIDLAEVLEPKALELAFDSALRQQGDLRASVLRVLKGWPRKGHQGIAPLRALAERTDSRSR